MLRISPANEFGKKIVGPMGEVTTIALFIFRVY
jgi:hypothetical protein